MISSGQGPRSIWKTIALATAIAGTLDLTAAFVFSAYYGTGPLGVLEFVASGPFGDRALGAPGFAVAGLIVHYVIMAGMVAVYMTMARSVAWLRLYLLIAGPAYGLLLWFVMYWIVRPLRWEKLQHPTHLVPILQQLSCHLLLVGVPIAVIAARRLGVRR